MKRIRKKNDGVRKLMEIYRNIPKVITEQIDLSQKEIISQYMDLFHTGPFFYLIFNTRIAEMEYVSPEVANILGYDAEEFNIELMVNIIHPEDQSYFYHYEQSAVKFFTELPEDLFLKYKFSYDYRMQTKWGTYKRILQQIVPIYYFPEGGARTLGIFTDIDYLNIQGIPKLSFIGMQGAPSYYNVHLDKQFHSVPALFTKREYEILQLIVKGFSSKEIAESLCRSIHTIRAHRKNILSKSGCFSLNELLVKSVREGWV